MQRPLGEMMDTHLAPGARAQPAQQTTRRPEDRGLKREGREGGDRTRFVLWFIE